MAKKTSKKTSARKAVKATRAARFAPEAKITMLTKSNPRRDGTVQFTRFAALLKAKTVGALPEKGRTGFVLALRRAVNEGHAKVA
jgi:hypothetical protein